MIFTSFAFAALLAVVLIARLSIGRANQGLAYMAVLLTASLVFYAWHIPACLSILLVSCAVDYFAAQKIAECKQQGRSARAYLVASLGTNLGMLAFFKYTNFALGSVRTLLAACGAGDGWVPTLNVILPMGISFYTFQSMSYTIDVYRGTLKPMTSFWRFLLYVSFFPQLVAGPIVRGADFIYQMQRRRRIRAPYVLEGLYLLIQGFFLKLVVADNIAPYVDQFWKDGVRPGAPASITLLLAALFASQIFADFAGYSSIARGLAYLLGYRFPVNFNSPYIATSFKDFWARWHITLSTWLREYLYIPLGGNRGSAMRTYVNLFLTMLLGGLWHGAAATFLIWGALHGTALIVERALGLHVPLTGYKRVLRIAWFPVVQLVVLITWIFFRSESASDAAQFVANMFTQTFRWEEAAILAPALLFVVPIVVMHLRGLAERWRPFGTLGLVERSGVAAVMLYALMTMYGASDGFLYFQF
jgi:alginate O-acetyltransferase complex protein AlgI